MTLGTQTQRLIRLSVGICLGEWELVADIRRAAPEGEPDRAWRETVLQAHLFAGFPRVVEACEVLAQAGGLGVPEPEEYTPDGDRAAQGLELFGKVYDQQAPRVREALSGFHPSLERWIVGHAYGRVLARPGLSAARRELAAVACLAALGQERQLASHVRGAIRVGADGEEVRETLALIADLIDERALHRSRRVVDRFLG